MDIIHQCHTCIGKLYSTSCGSPLLLAAEHSAPSLLLQVVIFACSLAQLCLLAPLMKQVLVVPLRIMTASSSNRCIAQVFRRGHLGILTCEVGNNHANFKLLVLFESRRLSHLPYVGAALSYCIVGAWRLLFFLVTLYLTSPILEITVGLMQFSL